MRVTFEEEYLETLYRDGVCKDKKHRYQPDVVRRYQKAVNYLKVSPSIESLWPIHSLNYEVLTGDRAGRSSVRINDKYRLEFEVLEDGESIDLIVCNLLEISNHYK